MGTWTTRFWGQKNDKPIKPLPKLTKWDERFLAICRRDRAWSKDPSTQVCAVIVKDGKREIAKGYNGFPRLIKDDGRLKDKEYKHLTVIHAELNAILSAREDLAGTTLYCSQFPCAPCASVIIQKSITKVVAYKGTYTNAERQSKIAKDNFDEAGIKWIEL